MIFILWKRLQTQAQVIPAPIGSAKVNALLDRPVLRIVSACDGPDIADRWQQQFVLPLRPIRAEG
jgi:hypothetical protein